MSKKLLSTIASSGTSEDTDDTALRPRTLLERHTASYRACKSGMTCEHHAPAFFAALAHSLKDRHIDPLGKDQWHLPLVLSTVLAYLYIRRWEVIFLLFAIYYLLEYAIFFIARRLTRRTTAAVTSRLQRSTELLTDPLIFVFALFAAWYAIDYSVFGEGVRGPAPTWYCVLVVGVSIFSGHARLYWTTLTLLLIAIWGGFLIYLLDGHSHRKQEYTLWLSLRASAIALFFFASFIQPINGHYLNNSLFALFLWLFFISTLQFVAQ